MDSDAHPYAALSNEQLAELFSEVCREVDKRRTEFEKQIDEIDQLTDLYYKDKRELRARFYPLYALDLSPEEQADELPF